MTVTPNYNSEMNLGGPLDAEKLAEAVLLYVFNIAFPASLFELRTKFQNDMCCECNWIIIVFKNNHLRFGCNKAATHPNVVGLVLSNPTPVPLES